MATAPAAAPGVPFTIASRVMRRFSNTQVANNLSGSTSFQPIPLPATGWVRKVGLNFVAATACASAGAIVAGDGPWNLVSGVTLTDATGQPIYQPISGYNLYLASKYLAFCGAAEPMPYNNPHYGPEFAFSSSATVGTAKFRLDLDFEQDNRTGYGCIPNLDSNASLLLKIDVAPYSVAFSGTTVSAASLSVTVDQWYYGPVAPSVGGVANATTPPGFGDFLETRYETQTVTASSENTVTVNNRGGFIKGLLVISRAAGTRTAFTAGSNVGVVYDNAAIDEGIKLETVQDNLRRVYGYFGTDLTTSYAPLTAGVNSGLDSGVLVFPFGVANLPTRNSWLNTRPGTQLQLRLTPGASATSLEIVTQLAQVRDAAAFFDSH